MKTKLMFRAALLALLAGLTGCGKAPSDNEAKTEALLQPFRGSWTIVSLDREGRKVPPAAARAIEVSVEGEKLTMVEMRPRSGGGAGLAVSDVYTDEYTLQVDPTKEAREVDLVYANGDKLGQIRPAIYEFDGSKLKLCVAAPGGPRPTDFAATKATTMIVMEKKQ